MAHPDQKPPSTSKQRRAFLALATTGCALLAAITYEVFRPSVADTPARPLVVLESHDDDATTLDGLLALDYEIRKLPAEDNGEDPNDPLEPTWIRGDYSWRINSSALVNHPATASMLALLQASGSAHHSNSHEAALHEEPATEQMNIIALSDKNKEDTNKNLQDITWNEDSEDEWSDDEEDDDDLDFYDDSEQDDFEEDEEGFNEDDDFYDDDDEELDPIDDVDEEGNRDLDILLATPEESLFDEEEELFGNDEDEEGDEDEESLATALS